MKKISAIIITKNEEDVIEGCLKSLRWADEIIVIDSGSTDRTIYLAKKYTKKVFIHKWAGYAKQKNYAISKSNNSWVLSIDADERVSHRLRLELQNLVLKSNVYAYKLPRLNIFLGKLMRHGGWNPDYQTRLFQKDKARFNEDNELHEFLSVEGRVNTVMSPLYHLSHRTIEDNLLKTREYALLAAKDMIKERTPSVTKFAIIKGVLVHFLNRYIRAKGYKDGFEGFIEAFYQAFSQVFIIQSILWEKQQKKSLSKLYKEIDERIASNTYEY